MHLRAPQPEEYRAWFASGHVRVVTVAPELEGSMEMIEAGALAGVEFAVGHSDADFETVVQAADHGLRQATHVFNAMLGLHHRRPGTLGAVLTDDRIYAQLIADGVHVHPAMVSWSCAPRRRPDDPDHGRHARHRPAGWSLRPGGQATYVNDGVARLEAGNLAGSTLTMDAALRNVMAFAGLSLTEALPMATAVPAEALHLTGRKGCIAAGADADIILLDSELQVARTIVGGQTVYQRD
jgi:N-acetylglucosamine-6-phosphate deacetylase